MPINYFPQIRSVDGESNFGENLGTGIGFYKDKSGLVLRFRSLKSTNSIINLIEKTSEVEIDLDLSNLDLNSCDNTIAEFLKKSEILNENDFISNSSEFPATQSSIKNYIENNTKLEHEAAPKLTSDALINDNLLLIKTDPANLKYSGIAIEANVSNNSIGVGVAMYLNSTGSYQEAGAAEAVANKCYAISLESGTGSKKLLLQGVLKNTSWNFTAGDKIFLSTTLGDISNTAPNLSGEIVQIIGFALSTDTIYFNPSFTEIELS